MSQRAQDEDDWESHWATFGDAARGNPANVFRTNIIARLLGRLDGSDRLIDVGCGEGDLLVDMHERFPTTQLLGVDISQEGISRAQKLVPSAEFFQVDLLDPGPELQRFDRFATHGVCSEVLEHLDDPVTFLRNAKSLFVPGSPMVVTVPAGPRSKFDRFIGHRQHFTPQRLRSILEEAGFEVSTIRSAGFPFFTLYRLTVIARGDRLLNDVQVKENKELTPVVRLALALFGLMFKFNLPSFPFGWQLVALVHIPGE